MQGRPLPDDLGIDARVRDLVGGDAGVLVGGGVAQAVAARLDRVHLDLGELGQDIGHLLETHPMELDVLARGEMAVAPVIDPRDAGELPELPRGEHAIGNGDAQHVGVELQIEPVHEPERPELLLAELAGEPPRHLVAELGDALVDEALVEFVVAVHGSGDLPRALVAAGGDRWALARMRSRRRAGVKRPLSSTTSMR